MAGAIVGESKTITDNFADLALATLTLNVPAMTISFCVARVARLERRQSTAIAMELGIHNSTLAITVAAGMATGWQSRPRSTACSCSPRRGRSPA